MESRNCAGERLLLAACGPIAGHVQCLEGRHQWPHILLVGRWYPVFHWQVVVIRWSLLTAVHILGLTIDERWFMDLVVRRWHPLTLWQAVVVRRQLVSMVRALGRLAVERWAIILVVLRFEFVACTFQAHELDWVRWLKYLCALVAVQLPAVVRRHILPQQDGETVQFEWFENSGVLQWTQSLPPAVGSGLLHVAMATPAGSQPNSEWRTPRSRCLVLCGQHGSSGEVGGGAAPGEYIRWYVGTTVQQPLPRALPVSHVASAVGEYLCGWWGGEWMGYVWLVVDGYAFGGTARLDRLEPAHAFARVRCAPATA